MNKNGFVGWIIVIVILLTVGFFWFVGEWHSVNDDVEYVKVQTTCCPCNMGGEEKCVPVSQEAEYLAKLEDCSGDTICAGVFNCEIENCTCDDESCVNS